MLQIASKSIDKMIGTVNISILCGFKESGKDTIANILEKEYNYKHYKISKFLYSTTTPHENAIARVKTDMMLQHEYQNHSVFSCFQNQKLIDELLQQIETEYILSSKPNLQNIVISDLKFINEYNAFIRLLYKYPHRVVINVIKLIRNNSPRYYNVDKHESDTDHLSFSYNYIIENNSSMDTLAKKIQNLHSQIQNDITKESYGRINMIINK